MIAMIFFDLKSSCPNEGAPMKHTIIACMLMGRDITLQCDEYLLWTRGGRNWLSLFGAVL